MSSSSPSPTTQELKRDVNAGKTGDKIPQGFDPGLSTLGTDDEAAGTPNTPEQVASAIRLETRGAASPSAEQGSDNPKRAMPAVWIMVAAIVAVIAVIAAAVLLGRG